MTNTSYVLSRLVLLWWLSLLVVILGFVVYWTNCISLPKAEKTCGSESTSFPDEILLAHFVEG